MREAVGEQEAEEAVEQIYTLELTYGASFGARMRILEHCDMRIAMLLLLINSLRIRILIYD